jgi:hypothetical protein
MGQLPQNWWLWVRGALAIMLAYLLSALAVIHAGHIVTNASTTPPTHHIVGRFSGSLPGVGVALFSLACIYVSMWKRWDFEIVGWVLLLVFIFAGIGH